MITCCGWWMTLHNTHNYRISRKLERDHQPEWFCSLFKTGSKTIFNNLPLWYQQHLTQRMEFIRNNWKFWKYLITNLKHELKNFGFPLYIFGIEIVGSYRNDNKKMWNVQKATSIVKRKEIMKKKLSGDCF